MDEKTQKALQVVQQHIGGSTTPVDGGKYVVSNVDTQKEKPLEPHSTTNWYTSQEDIANNTPFMTDINGKTQSTPSISFDANTNNFVVTAPKTYLDSNYYKNNVKPKLDALVGKNLTDPKVQNSFDTDFTPAFNKSISNWAQKQSLSAQGISNEDQQDKIISMQSAIDDVKDTSKLKNINIPASVQKITAPGGLGNLWIEKKGLNWDPTKTQTVTDFLDQFKQADDGAKDKLIKLLVDGVNDDKNSAYDRMRYGQIAQLLQDVNEKNNDYKGILNAGLSTQLNRATAGFFQALGDSNLLTGGVTRLANFGNEPDYLKTSYLSGADNYVPFTYTLGKVGGLAADLAVTGGAQGAIVRGVSAKIASNSVKIANIAKNIDTFGKAGYDAIRTLGAQNKAMNIGLNLLGEGSNVGSEVLKGVTSSDILKGIGTWIDPIGNTAYGVGYTLIHPNSEQYGKSYDFNDFLNDAKDNILFLGGLRAGLKGLSIVGQTPMGRAAARGARKIGKIITESKVGKFFSNHLGNGFGEVRNAARNASIKLKDDGLAQAKVDDAITSVNRGGSDIMTQELNKSPHTQETFGKNGQWDNFVKKYRTSNPLDRTIKRLNPETRKMESIKTTDGLSAKAEQAMGDASKYWDLDGEVNAARASGDKNAYELAVNYRDRVAKDMEAKYGSNLTKDSLNMAEFFGRSKSRGGSASSDLEDIGVRRGMTDADIQRSLEQNDPRFAKVYMTMQQYRPTVPGGTTVNMAGNQNLLKGNRSRNIEQIYKMDYMNPIRAYQMKVQAMGRAIAWNHLRQILSEISEATGSTVVTFNQKQLDNISKQVDLAQQNLSNYRQTIEDVLARGGLNDQAMVDVPLGGADSPAAKMKSDNPDAFVPKENLFTDTPTTVQAEAVGETPTAATEVTATTATETAEPVAGKNGKVTKREQDIAAAAQAKQKLQANIDKLKAQATEAQDSSVLTSNLREYNVLDASRDSGIKLTNNIVNNIPDAVVDGLPQAQRDAFNAIRYGDSTDYSVLSDNIALRNYFDAQGVQAIRQPDGKTVYLTDQYRLFDRQITDDQINKMIDEDIQGDGLQEAINLEMERTVDQLMRNDDIYNSVLSQCVGTSNSPRSILMSALAGDKTFGKRLADKVIDRLYTGTYRYPQTIDAIIHEIEPTLFPKDWKIGDKRLTADNFPKTKRGDARYKRYEELRSNTDIQDYAQELVPSTKKELNSTVRSYIKDYAQANYAKDAMDPAQLWNMEQLSKTQNEMKSQKKTIDEIDNDPQHRYADYDGKRVSYIKVETANGAEYHLTTDISAANMIRTATRKYDTMGSFGKLLNATSRIYRFGTTSFNFNALVRNSVRDPIQAWFESGWNPTDLRMQYPGGIVGYLQNSDEFMTELRKLYGDDAPQHLMVVAQRVADDIRGVSGATETNVISGRYNSMDQLTHQGLFKKVINMAEKPGNAWEANMRSSVGAQTFIKMLQSGKSIDESLAWAKFYASNATTNFTNSIGGLTNMARTVPYLQSAFNGSTSFFRILEQDPLGVSARIISSVIGPEIMVTMNNLNDPEKRKKYEQIPDWVKSQNIIYITDNGYCIIIPLPQEAFPFFNTTRRFIETSYGINPEPWQRTLARGVFGFSPVDISWLADLGADGQDGNIQQQILTGVGKTASSLIPQFGSAAYSLATGKDLYTGSDTYGNPNSPVLIGIAKMFGANVDNENDRTQAAANVQKVLQSIFGSNANYVINGIDTIMGAPKGERGGKNFLDDIAKTFTGVGYKQADSDFSKFISKQDDAKKKLMESTLPAIDRQISDAEKTSDEKTVEGLKAQRQQAIDTYTQGIIDGLKQYQKMYQQTGGIDDSRKQQLLNLLNLGISSSSISTGNLNEDSWGGAAYDEASKSEYADALQRYVDLGLPDSTVDYPYKDKYGKWQSIESIATKNAIQRGYGAPKQMVYDVKQALQSGINGVSLYDIKKNYKAQIDALYDDAKKKGKSPDYKKIAEIQRQYLGEFDKVMGPQLKKYGSFMVTNNDVVDELRSSLSGMIPTEEYQKNKKGRYQSMPMMEVNTWKWLQKHYGIGYGNTKGMPSDDEVGQAISRINIALDKNKVATAQALAKRLNTKIGSGQLFANKRDMDRLTNILNY